MFYFITLFWSNSRDFKLELSYIRSLLNGFFVSSSFHDCPCHYSNPCKALDTLNHKLLLEKLQAYSFDKKSLSFIESYFINRKQRTKIGDSFNK